LSRSYSMPGNSNVKVTHVVVVGQFKFKKPPGTGNAGALARIESEARTRFLRGLAWPGSAREGARVPVV